ncbi:MAG TPA: universal stress protein [Geminicoccus sp.]|jgi:nucleotide-binding universal stress UspA family protein|uniref:universal stress protein n=1 Tax=Geminicoccus sp. TaxID=2024832 RepID=UPI002E303B01|nr:universal stress protein [Geminicoccus sp.]HEX2527320.1 universal stress protein [Geminicoccus sp.]
MSDTILALIDGSVYAASVCDLAGWAAGRTGRSVELVHVLGRRDSASTPVNLSGDLGFDAQETLLAELAALDAQKAKLAQQRGRLILAQAKARLEAAGVTVPPPKLRVGDLLETVQELQADADLIVIGKRGEAADFAKLHLGSNLERVARAAHKPVLVAARSFQPIRRVLIAFDGGQSATKAVSFIAYGALLKGLEIHLLTVGGETTAAREALEQAQGVLRAAGYAAEGWIVPGEADKVIARHVQDQAIDLLVMGAFGHARLRNLFIGSTTTEMIRSCKVPIMLFR